MATWGELYEPSNPPDWLVFVSANSPAPGTDAYNDKREAELLAALAGEYIVAPEELEAALADASPYEVAWLLNQLQAIPEDWRRDFMESLRVGAIPDPYSYAARLVAQHEAFKDGPDRWDWDWTFGSGTFWSLLGNLGGFAIGLALGGLVGYAATWLGATAGGAIASTFWGSVAQLGVTAGVAYGAAELGEWILTEDYQQSMTPFGEWLMSGAYVGGILGGAYYVYSQIPDITTQFGIGYTEGWFDDLVNKGAEVAFRTYSAITGVPMPTVVSAQTTTHWWWAKEWSTRGGWATIAPLVIEGQQ